MSRKKKDQYKKAEKDIVPEVENDAFINDIKIRNITLVILGLLVVISFLSLFDLSGKFGIMLNNVLTFIFGFGRYFLPVFLALLFGLYIKSKQIHKLIALGVLFIFFSALSFMELFHMFPLFNFGGVVGKYFIFPFLQLTGEIASFFIMLAIMFIGIVFIIDRPIDEPFRNFINLFRGKKKEEGEENIEDFKFQVNKLDSAKFQVGKVETEEINKMENAKFQFPIFKDENVHNKAGKEKHAPSGGDIQPSALKKLNIPKKELYLPMELLEERKGLASAGDINGNLMIIEKTLENFNIPVAMGDVKVGPTVTQYSFKPANGVKLSKIVALQNDLALALAANSLRMEAPIPGKSLVGIEVPNKIAAIVSMKEMLNSDEFRNRKSNLSLLLGKDVSGKCFIADLATMPHLLIAGSTGTGKSVCIHGIIASLMFQNSPDDIKFILIDPKRVEMTLYNGIPYLLTPPVTEPKKIINSLKWAVAEMDRRYQILANAKKVNITSFNESVTEEEKLPIIIIVVDELADLMMLSRAEVEPCIIRIAQLARAIGIHLVLATQRPSVNVITGLIKANIPARIAFAVVSSIDSRTILDEIGAEKLLGKGDMLYSASNLPKSIRLQGAYVADDEIRKLSLHLKSMDFNVEYDNSIVEKKSLITNGGVTSSGFNADDDLFEEAVDEVTRSKRASTSLLQRKFRIGYARAARLMDLLEEAGIVGPSDGAKAREVYAVSPDESAEVEDEENWEKEDEEYNDDDDLEGRVG